MYVLRGAPDNVLRVCALLLLCFVSSGTCNGDMYALSDEFIRKVNNIQGLWRAGRNFRADAPENLVRALVGPTTPSGECLSCAAGMACYIARITAEPRICGEAMAAVAIVGGTGVAVGGGVAIVGGVALIAAATVAGCTAITVGGIAAYFIIKAKWPIIKELLMQVGFCKYPDHFDSRQKWPHCAHVINDIKDTGLVASTWALAVTAAMEDRYCIKNEGSPIITFSAQQLLDCCAFCGRKNCEGGSAIAAYEYFYTYGLPSGGAFSYRGPINGCKPYAFIPLKQCLIIGRKNCCFIPKEKVCSSNCSNPVYDRGVEIESYKIYDYFMHSEDMLDTFTNNKGIKVEIYLRGSVTATISVYDDFLNYKIGVYSPSSCAKPFGQIVVKVIGWGIEGGVDYWLAANAWGKGWGEDGFVKLKANDKILKVESMFTIGRVDEV